LCSYQSSQTKLQHLGTSFRKPRAFIQVPSVNGCSMVAVLIQEHFQL